jgi:predicted GH43/DUF377 family glycosyl hydrolase
MKKINLFVLMTMLSFSIYCQTHWTKHTEPVLDVGPEGSWDDRGVATPCVLYINDTLHMWYAGVSNISDLISIGYATSTDGFTWDKDTLNPVLTGGGEGSWDQEDVYVPNVLFLDTIYYMWYNGNDGGGESLCLATSPDGRYWTKHPDNPVLDAGETGSWDSDHVGPGSVYYDSAFHLWYGGIKGGFVRSGYATSQDGIHWTKHPDNPVLESESVEDWDYPRIQLSTIVYENSIFHGWYGGGQMLEWDIGYMSSTDGIEWEKNENNPVLNKGESGDWDEGFVAFTTVLYDEAASIFRMWYTGGKGLDAYSHKIGYAETPPVGIDKHEADRLIIYPNPTDGLVNIQLVKPGECIVEIASLNGQLIYSEEMEGTTHQLDLFFLQNGAYFITIRSNDFVITRKIIKM